MNIWKFICINEESDAYVRVHYRSKETVVTLGVTTMVSVVSKTNLPSNGTKVVSTGTTTSLAI